MEVEKALNALFVWSCIFGGVAAVVIGSKTSLRLILHNCSRSLMISVPVGAIAATVAGIFSGGTAAIGAFVGTVLWGVVLSSLRSTISIKRNGNDDSDIKD